MSNAYNVFIIIRDAKLLPSTANYEPKTLLAVKLTDYIYTPNRM